MPKETIKEIVNNYKDEIRQVNELIEEIDLNEGIGLKYKIKLKEMGIIYQLSFFESFNRNFFIELFYDHPYKILRKEPKKPTDMKKLVLSYKEIIELDYEVGDNRNLLLEKMAGKMYSKIYNYHKMSINIFIYKLIDSFLGLNFSQKASEREYNVKQIQDFRDYRNKLVHRDRLESEHNKFLDNLKLKNLLTDFINLIEELVLNEYYTPDKDQDRFYL